MAKSASKLHKIAGVAALPSQGDHVDPYMVREALHTIHKADEHRRNKPLMREVKKLAKAQAKSVCK